MGTNNTQAKMVYLCAGIRWHGEMSKNIICMKPYKYLQQTHYGGDDFIIDNLWHNIISSRQISDKL